MREGMDVIEALLELRRDVPGELYEYWSQVLATPLARIRRVVE